MATLTVQSAGVARTISGNSPQILTFPEAASQSYKKGQHVYLVSGKVTVCGVSSNVINTQILGMAAADASGTTDTDAPVYMANADTIFYANKVTSADAASATAVTDIGLGFAIYQDDTNKKDSIYQTDGTSQRVYALDHDNRDTVTDTGGRILYQIIPKHRQLGATS